MTASGPLPPELTVVSAGELFARATDPRAWTGAVPVSPCDGWLTPSERETYRSLTVHRRRRQWLAGRMAAKQAICRRHALPPGEGWAAVEIEAVATGFDHGRPRYRISGQPGPFVLSIAHSGDTAVAALGQRPGERIGVDLEAVERRPRSLGDLVLRPAESRRLAALPEPDRSREMTRAWVLKEALAKALGCGLRLPFRALDMALHPGATFGLFELDGLQGAWVTLPPQDVTGRS